MPVLKQVVPNLDCDEMRCTEEMQTQIAGLKSEFCIIDREEPPHAPASPKEAGMAKK